MNIRFDSASPNNNVLTVLDKCARHFILISSLHHCCSMLILHFSPPALPLTRYSYTAVTSQKPLVTILCLIDLWQPLCSYQVKPSRGKQRLWQDTDAVPWLSMADSNFLCAARGSLWVTCRSGGHRVFSLQRRLDGWADLILRWADVFLVNTWCKTKTEATNIGQPSGGDPIVSPLLLNRHERRECRHSLFPNRGESSSARPQCWHCWWRRVPVEYSTHTEPPSQSSPSKI